VEQAAGVFRIAHNWREAHLFPMRKVRFELSGAAKRVKANGITVARLKRMKSIRKKLRHSPRTLYQMQDIGGCRTIVNTTDQQRALISLYGEGFSRHGIVSQWAYIDHPKPEGYRSHHISIKFTGPDEEEAYNRQRIEIQIRTRLQHAWATAVEAAGVVRREI
jgi:ppGpp synthetase/RelA/SpoT-type nucleotidyltranferase